MAKTAQAVAETSNTETFMGPRLREGAFIGVSAVCLYLLLALAQTTAAIGQQSRHDAHGVNTQILLLPLAVVAVAARG